MRGATGATLGLLAVPIVLLGAGCLGPVVRADDGYRHRKHDYRVAAPDGPGPSWERVDVEGAALSFRRPGPDTLSLISRCGRPVAEPQLMARHLVMGMPQRALVAAGPVAVDGHSGWTQTLDIPRDAATVRVKTVTLVVGDCTFDWILAAAGPFEPAEAAFDAWWGSFQLGPRYLPEREE